MSDNKIEEIQELDQSRVLQSWSRQKNKRNNIIIKSQGVKFTDQKGREYYDMSSQLVYANLGHKHPKMLEAFNQLSGLEIVATGFASSSKSELAEKIIDVAPSNMKKVYFTMAGAEANEHAIKIARMVTGKHKILSRYRSYHGSTFGAGNLSGESRRFQVEPGLPGFIKFKTPYLYREKLTFSDELDYTNYLLSELDKQIQFEGPEDIAAIFIEPIPGSNGVLLPPEGYLTGLSTLCKRYDILLICDEVMSGFGRTGKWFAVDHFNVQPDIITFAKGVTAGYLPLGGVIVSDRIAEYFDENVLMTGSTYSGHAMACHMGCAALNVYHQEEIISHVQEMESVINSRLEKLKEYKYVGDVRNIGLFSAIELVKDKQTKEPIIDYGQDYGKDLQGHMSTLLACLLDKGFYTYSHESCIFISPPLTITKEEIERAFDLLELGLTQFILDHPSLT